MPAAKEVRNKIKSVKNTQKITKAMEMVAASKMRRAQERMRHARPYAEKIRDVCAHLASANSEYHHPFLVPRDNAESMGLILVTTDKGLCGGMNTNALRLAASQMQEWEEQQNQSVLVSGIGGKGVGFLNNLKVPIISEYAGYGDHPDASSLVGTLKVMFDAYLEGRVGEVHLIYTQFINTVKQNPVHERLLPVPKEIFQQERRNAWDYIYEPEAAPVMNVLLTRYIETVVYQSVVENIASEQAARMVAMKAASDNAGNLIDELQLVYNKSRQASITQEIAEIVGGAAAV